VTAHARPAVEPIAAAGQPAGLVTRMLAFAADALVIELTAWAAGAVAAVVVTALGLSGGTQHRLLGAGAILSVVWAAGYFVLFWSTTGQTPGNRLMQIRVQASGDAGSLSKRRSLLRFLGILLSVALLFVPFVVILIDGRRRGLHDRIAGSEVSYAPPIRGHR
jgi:uncharacterized RDD family membrane protein YckC